MGLSNTIALLLISNLMFGVLGNAQLTSDFYSTTCPNVTVIARGLLEQASRSDVRLTAQVMRLHFHDCFVNVRSILFISIFEVIMKTTDWLTKKMKPIDSMRIWSHDSC